MIRETLKQLNLTETEVQVYVTCLSLGQTLVSTLAKKCGIKRTSAYAVVEKLMKKGLITSIVKNNVHYYLAVDPEVLLERFQQLASQAERNVFSFTKILPMLNNMKTEGGRVHVQFFSGFEGLKSLYEDALKESKPVNAIHPSSKACKKVIEYLVGSYSKKRKEQDVSQSKVIILDDHFTKTYMEGNYNVEPHQLRALGKEYLDIDVSIQLYGDKSAFYAFSDETDLFGILIESKTVSDTLNKLFLLVWEFAKLKQGEK